MRIAVTGSTGFIGRVLCAQLLEAGHDVIGVARSRHTVDLLDRGLVEEPALAQALFADDDASTQAGRALAGVDVVFHLAGDPSFGDGAHYEQVNLRPTERLAALTAQHAPQLRAFVLASSLGAQDKSPDEPLARALDEESHPAPTTDYGRSKLAAERALLATGLPVRVARLGMVVGADMRPGSHVAALCALRARVPDRVLAQLRGVLPIVHVDDACRALELLATAPGADQRPYLIVADNVSVRQVIRVLAGDDAVGPEPDGRSTPLAAVRTHLPFRLRSMLLPELRVNATRIRSLGWEPKVAWTDAIGEVDARVRARASFDVEPAGWTVVTGAGSGLGRAVAARIAPHRSRLLLVDRDAAGLAATAEHLSDAATLVADVADPATPHAIAEAVGARGSHVAELFLCAGLGRKGSVGRVDAERELSSIDVNLRARIATVTELLRELTQRHFGRIVLVSSSSAFQPLPEFASYGAASAGLLAFGQALASELEDSGVHVLTVVPGGMDTKFQATAGVRRLEGERLLPPEVVADRIVDALDRQQAVVVVGARAKGMDALARVLPRSVQRRLWKRLVRDLR